MDYKIQLTVFSAIFMAELDDKFQLANLLFVAERELGKLTVLFGASLTPIVAFASGVLAGGLVDEYVGERLLRSVAGAGFIGIGVWTRRKA